MAATVVGRPHISIPESPQMRSIYARFVIGLAIVLVLRTDGRAADGDDRATLLKQNRILKAEKRLLEEQLSYERERSAEFGLEIKELKRKLVVLREILREGKPELQSDDAERTLPDDGLFPSMRRTNEIADELTEEDRPNAPLPESDTTLEMTTVYRSVVQMLNDLPSDLRPKNRDGWDRYDFVKVRRWFETELPKHRFDMTFTVLKVNVAWAHGTDETGEPMYRVTVSLKSNEQPYLNTTARHYGGSLFFKGDAAFAKRAGRLREGQHIRVSGMIDKMQIHKGSDRYDIRLDSKLIDTNASALHGAVHATKGVPVM